MNYRQLSATKGELKFYGNVSEWWISGDDFTRTIQEMENRFTEIDIRMHCYGGSVFEGNVIFNTLLRCKAKVKIFIDGVAASMASIIIMSVAEVEAAANAFIMVHSPYGVTEGNAKDHYASAKLLTGMEKNFAKAYAARTGKAEKDVAYLFDGADHWFTADEAKQFGLVTSVNPLIVASTQNAAKPDKGNSVEGLFSQYSALLTAPIAQTQISKSKMKKALIDEYGLTGLTENSTDAEVQAALKAKFAGKETEGREAVLKTSVAALIGYTESIGASYTDAQKATFTAIGEKMGIEHLQAVLGLPAVAPSSVPPAGGSGVPPKPPVAQVVNLINNGANGANASADDRSKWSWDDWQAKDDEGLEKLRKTDNAAFVALGKARFGEDFTD